METITLITYFTFGFCFIVILFLGPFVSRMQSATLWVGKKIAPGWLEKEAPRGFQDAITPEFQNKGNLVVMASYLVLLVSGTLIVWYGGVAGLVVAFALSSFIGGFYPKDIAFYLSKIIGDMYKRHADYKRDNDTERAGATLEMLQKLQELYNAIKEEDIQIPPMQDIRAMDLGGR